VETGEPGAPYEPIFNVPTPIVATLALLAAIHALLWWWLPSDEATRTTLALAFIPARFSGFYAELPGGPSAAITSFVTYQLVHVDTAHLLINGAWLLAFGSAVAARVGARRFFIFSLLSGVGGALVFLCLRWGEPVPVVGASGAVSGLMAATLRFLFAALDQGGLQGLRENPGRVELASLADTLRNTRILMVVGLWIIINLVMAGVAPVITSAGGIAWEVHLGGFLFGLLAFGAFDRARRPRASRP
jgi:membrane associated rhomboid family serine protease